MLIICQQIFDYKRFACQVNDIQVQRMRGWVVSLPFTGFVGDDMGVSKLLFFKLSVELRMH